MRMLTLHNNLILLLLICLQKILFALPAVFEIHLAEPSDPRLTLAGWTILNAFIRCVVTLPCIVSSALHRSVYAL